MKGTQLVMALVLLAAALSGCAKAETATPPPLTQAAAPTRSPETTRAARSDVTIIADGQLVAVNPVLPLGFSISGRLLTMTVQVGDIVAAGDLLAELKVSELEDRLAQAQLNLQTTEAALSRAEQDSADALFEARVYLEKLGIRLEQAQAQDTEASISIAYIRLRQAETSLASAQEAYDRAWEPARDWELHMIDPTGIPPFQGPSMSDQLKQERDGTARGLTMANDNLTIARIDYGQAVSTSESHDYDLQTLEQDLELAEFRIEQLERGIDPSLALNVDKARLEIETIEEQMNEAQLFSPWAGIILSVDTAPGALVGAGAPIITLFDPSELEFHTTNLSERDLAQITLGRPARIVLKTYPDHPLEGAIARIAHQAGPMLGDAATFSLIIELGSSDLDLRPGMTGRVEIATEP